MNDQATVPCQHVWCPFPFDMTRVWCLRCRGKTTVKTLRIIDAMQHEQAREVTVGISLDYA